MTAGGELDTSLRRATVVVVFNASDHDHFVVSGESVFRKAKPAWAALRFIADHDIAEELGALLDDGAVDAVVFASNSLSTAAAQHAVADFSFARRWAEDGPNRDVGVLVLHQYLAPGATLALDFLGSAALTIVGERARRVERAALRFPRDWLFTEETPYPERAKRFLAVADGYGSEGFGLWTRHEPRYPAQWEPLVWEEGGERLVASSSAGLRFVAASRVPIDFTGNTELLGSLIAACLRPRGCLLAAPPGISSSRAFTPALASAIERGRFVHRESPKAASEIDPAKAPYHFFDELIVAPDWRVEEIAPLHETAVLRKLEQGGSIVATFTGPAATQVTVRLTGPPQYVVRANHLASWLLPRLESFKPDLWAMRGLAEAIKATRKAFEDERLIPPALRQQYVARHLGPALEARVNGDNVDDNVLATLGCYAALKALGIKGHEDLLAWARKGLDGNPPSAIAQAMLLVPELATERRRELVLAAAKRGSPSTDDPRLLKAYAGVLFAADEPGLLRAAATEPALGLGVQAELLRAVARNEIPVDDGIVGMAALVRDRIDRLAEAEGGLEAVCIGNAALIELARRQGIGPTAAVGGRRREVDVQTFENTELVRQREDARRQAAGARHLAWLVVTLSVWALGLATAALVAAIFIWYGKGIGDKWGLATSVFGVLSALNGYVLAKARGAGITPWPLSRGR